MFAEWVTQGVGWGVRVAFAAFTVIGIAGLITALLAVLIALTKGNDDEL